MGSVAGSCGGVHSDVVLTGRGRLLRPRHARRSRTCTTVPPATPCRLRPRRFPPQPPEPLRCTPAGPRSHYDPPALAAPAPWPLAPRRAGAAPTGDSAVRQALQASRVASVVAFDRCRLTQPLRTIGGAPCTSMHVYAPSQHLCTLCRWPRWGYAASQCAWGCRHACPRCVKRCSVVGTLRTHSPS